MYVTDNRGYNVFIGVNQSDQCYQCLKVSIQNIKLAFGIEKMPVRAAEGLRRTFESFKK